MTDIVERLRGHDPSKWCVADTDTGTLVREAADEIDRLRDLFRLDGEQHAARVKEVQNEQDARLTAYKREIERLRAALKECSDELAEYVEAHYAETKDHPAMKRRYDRDMQSVLDARRVLKQKPD